MLVQGARAGPAPMTLTAVWISHIVHGSRTILYDALFPSGTEMLWREPR